MKENIENIKNEISLYLAVNNHISRKDLFDFKMNYLGKTGSISALLGACSTTACINTAANCS